MFTNIWQLHVLKWMLILAHCLHFLQGYFQANLWEALSAPRAQRLSSRGWALLVGVQALPPSWPRCQHHTVWSPAPLEQPQGVYHLWLTHSSFPLCAMCSALCICRACKSRITQSQLLWHLKKLERKSKLFQFFLSNLLSFRKEGNMQWQVWLWMFLGRVNLWV